MKLVGGGGGGGGGGKTAELFCRILANHRQITDLSSFSYRDFNSDFHHNLSPSLLVLLNNLQTHLDPSARAYQLFKKTKSTSAHVWQLLRQNRNIFIPHISKNVNRNIFQDLGKRASWNTNYGTHNFYEQIIFPQMRFSVISTTVAMSSILFSQTRKGRKR